MKAAILTEYRQFEWGELPEPEIGNNDVLVKVEYAGICGSDMHIYNGDFVPRTKTPMVPGHEFAGKIVAVGKNVTRAKVGDSVAVDPIIWCGKCSACEIGRYPACTSLKLIGVDMDGGFGEFVAAHENMLYKLPDSVSTRHAALVEFYSIGFHASNRAGLKQNDTVLIWGAGKIGQGLLQAARTKTQNTIFCVDVLSSRLAMAKAAYPEIVTIDLNKQDPIAVVKEITNGRGVDVAFEVVGHFHPVAERPEPVRGCVQSIRGAGTVCALGLGDAPTGILMKELIWKEAKIVTSRVSHGEFKEAIEHLAKGNLKPDSLISTELPGKAAQKAFNLVEQHPEEYLKVLLKISE